MNEFYNRSGFVLIKWILEIFRDRFTCLEKDYFSVAI